MKWIRKITLLIVLVLCLCFAACGSSNNGSTNPSSNGVNDASSGTPVPEETQKPEKVKELPVEDEVVIELGEDENVGGL